MKKEYMKPQMQVVMLMQRNCLLAGSPDAFDSKSVDLQDGHVENENDIF